MTEDDTIENELDRGLDRRIRARPRTTQGHARQRKVERAMGIEPTREDIPDLENKLFGAIANAECD
jgi:hypothetical protein